MASFALPEDLSAALGKSAKNALDKLASSSTDQPVESDHLPCPHPHTDVFEAFPTQLFGAEDLLTKGNRLLVMNLLDRAGDHARDQLFLVGLRNALGRDERSVAQNGDTVGQLKDFFQPVGI